LGFVVVESRKRLAIIVSHPIQYYAPLYQRLALREDILVKVFFTWHDGRTAVEDRGFKTSLEWDVPLTEGYEFELVPNVSPSPGTHHFFGLRNPSLVERVVAWRPDIVHITGWAWFSHLIALRAFNKRGIPTLFRGDSHLLHSCQRGPRWWIKRALLKRVFSWPTAFLVVGKANRAYYQAFGVGPVRLWQCPHSIDVIRFAEPANLLEEEATRWRQQLQIGRRDCVLLFAGKFERNKRPLELMRAVQSVSETDLVLVMVGSGELDAEVKAVANADPKRFRLLSFQNQSVMPLVYRLGDLFVLPSSGETWGLAVNEAIACGRPVLLSDRVGCATDVLDGSFGAVYSFADSSALLGKLTEMLKNRHRFKEMGRMATRKAWCFDIARTEDALIECLFRTCSK
jgi:glycosyltransferase involved in cell wall biosynthesis